MRDGLFDKLDLRNLLVEFCEWSGENKRAEIYTSPDLLICIENVTTILISSRYFLSGVSEDSSLYSSALHLLF